MENNEKTLKIFQNFIQKNKMKPPESLPQDVKEIVLDVQKIEKWSKK